MQKRSNVLACLHGAWAPPSHAPLPAQEFFWGAVQRAGGVRSRVIQKKTAVAWPAWPRPLQ